MDIQKIKLGERAGFGKAVFAVFPIKKDEVLAEFDGEIWEAEKCTDLPKDIADHVVQFEEHKFRESVGIARYLNHSCEPNCGIKDLFKIVAMRDIAEGEELTWDYDMTEDSDWRMECKCGTPSCRKVIGAFGNIPQKIREKYGSYISDWLRKKYHIDN